MERGRRRITRAGADPSELERSRRAVRATASLSPAPAPWTLPTPIRCSPGSADVAIRLRPGCGHCARVATSPLPAIVWRSMGSTPRWTRTMSRAASPIPGRHPTARPLSRPIFTPQNSISMPWRRSPSPPWTRTALHRRVRARWRSISARRPWPASTRGRSRRRSSSIPARCRSSICRLANWAVPRSTFQDASTSCRRSRAAASRSISVPVRLPICRVCWDSLRRRPRMSCAAPPIVWRRQNCTAR